MAKLRHIAMIVDDLQKAAAFYDLEGTLVSTNLVHTLGFYARRQAGILPTVKKSVQTLAKLPFFGITDLYSRNVFNEVFFQSYKMIFFI